MRRLVAIEGLGPGPRSAAEREAKPIDERMRDWIAEQRAQAAEVPWRYPSLEAALKRMQEANKHLSDDMARHLTEHARQPERGRHLLLEIRPLCPGLAAERHDARGDRQPLGPHRLPHAAGLRHAKAGPPTRPPTAACNYFHTAEVLEVPGAGHWVHHDRPDVFLPAVRAFLAGG